MVKVIRGPMGRPLHGGPSTRPGNYDKNPLFAPEDIRRFDITGRGETKNHLQARLGGCRSGLSPPIRLRR